jgi:exodeoxyribonuclease VII small subunit
MENTDNTPQKDLQDLSYEEAIAELESIVNKLERGEAKLAESAALYTRGVQLARHCSSILKSMEESLSKLTIDSEGELVDQKVDSYERESR